MSYLERLKRRDTPTKGTDKTDRSPFVSFVSTQGGPFREIKDRAAVEERTAVLAHEAELLALVERVALAYSTPPDELATMKRLALADPGAAWSAFLATARTEGIQ